MAYDRKDGFSYIDDIPLKIASAFLPPSSVSLPTVLNPDEEVFFRKLQYDFSLEKKVLEDIKRDEQALENASKTTSNELHQEPVTDPSVKSSMQNMLSLQSDILLPEPQKILDKVPKNDVQKNSKINLSDFENDTSSPFDYMELQTINDLEELSNVFQGINNKYNSDNNVCKDKCVSSCLNENNVASNVSKSMSFPLQNNDTAFENSEKYLNLKETNVHSHNAWSASLTFPKENCFDPVPPPLKNENKCCTIADENLPRTFISSVLPEVPCLPSATAKISNSEIGFSPKSALRGCKSYSDIHDLSEKSIKMSMHQGRPSTPPSIFSTDGIASSLSVQDSKISSGDVNCDNSTSMSDLPDPYYELSEEGRSFVDAVADMGFPRAQVSRTVKHLGTDEKTVVEHLCQIQNLEECGYDCLEAEAALHLHDYNQDQAKQFLDLISKFQDLGFEKNAVMKALIQNKNDEGKTIDALLS